MVRQGNGPASFASTVTVRQLSLTAATPEGIPTDSTSEQLTPELIRYLSTDGQIKGQEGGSKVITTVAINGQVFTPEHELLSKTCPSGVFTIYTPLTDGESMIGHH
jgi:hypothetical protein